MVEQVNPGDQNQFLLGDFNTRLRDIDERNKLIRERVLLLGKNLISSREDLENELKAIRTENREMKKDIEKIKKVSQSLLTEFGKFIKRDEMAIIERMLKDFQPLEFMRKKDVEELIEETLSNKKKRLTAPQETNKNIKIME
tara:strand:+ start:13365 stop:13790 length:426 start_codon:yes stop_codon:yes gene_type:complete